jgi:hypothetical protein
MLLASPRRCPGLRVTPEFLRARRSRHVNRVGIATALRTDGTRPSRTARSIHPSVMPKRCLTNNAFAHTPSKAMKDASDLLPAILAFALGCGGRANATNEAGSDAGIQDASISDASAECGRSTGRVPRQHRGERRLPVPTGRFKAVLVTESCEKRTPTAFWTPRLVDHHAGERLGGRRGENHAGDAVSMLSLGHRIIRRVVSFFAFAGVVRYGSTRSKPDSRSSRRFGVQFECTKSGRCRRSTRHDATCV